jgi:hypothetical protein
VWVLDTYLVGLEYHRLHYERGSGEGAVPEALEAFVFEAGQPYILVHQENTLVAG